MTKQNLLVFDIDGTLLDSEQVHQTGFVNALHVLGVENVNTHWETYEHLTDSYIAKQNYESVGNRRFSNQVLEQFEDEFLHQIKSCKGFEIKGANAFIQFILQYTDYALCFATGSLLKPVLYKLKEAKIEYINELLETGSAYYSREEIVLAAIAKAKNYFKVQKFNRIISIGDGVWDVKTALNLELEFIGIGYNNREKLRQSGATTHFENFLTFNKDIL